MPSSRGWTQAAVDIEAYLADQVSDDTHREVIGPPLPASGGSGVVLVGGEEVATWGQPDQPEMAFSATKSVVSLVAGVAFDEGLLRPNEPVREVVELPALDSPLEPG